MFANCVRKLRISQRVQLLENANGNPISLIRLYVVKTQLIKNSHHQKALVKIPPMFERELDDLSHWPLQSLWPGRPAPAGF